MKHVLVFGDGVMVVMLHQWCWVYNKMFISVVLLFHPFLIGSFIVKKIIDKFFTFSYNLIFLLLDSAFTERILGLPAENYKGYVEADATQRAKHIPSNSFFLIHGLSDFTAPYLHSVELARSLTEAGVLFKYQV